MYEPSINFYSDVVQAQARRITWGGIVTADGVDYPFTAENIAKGSGRITNEISGSNMELGTVYSSELEIGLWIDDIGIPRNKIYGAEISLNCTLTANNETGTIPMGIFKVIEATQKGQLCSITAYDRMILFDAVVPISSGQQAPYDWLAQLCGECSVTLGNTRAEIEALPNGSLVLGMNWTDSENTYRDVLAQLSAALGSSAHIGRDGSLYIHPLTNSASVCTMAAKDRFGSDIANNQWTPNTFYVTNRDSGGIFSVGSGQLAFNLGQNVFLQQPGYELDPVTGTVTDTKTINQMLGNLLTSAHSLTVVPIEADSPLDPCLDLFDIVTLTGGQANNTKIIITSLIHTIGGGTAIKCSGANVTEQPSATARGTESDKGTLVWISGAVLETVMGEGKTVETSEQTWGDQLEKTWGELRSFTWGELLDGGGWYELTSFERTFAAEYCLGVLGLTVEYEVDKDTDVSLKLSLERWDDVLAEYVEINRFVTTEHAIRGKHTTTTVNPFGILDTEENDVYRVTAYISGVDVADELKILTKSEIEALIGGDSE